MDNFTYCLQVGKETEQKISNYLENRGHNVTNVSDNKEYQRKDIDLLLEHNNRNASLEIKSDSKIHYTNNLFFEDGFDRKTGYYNGWLNYCEANYICFYDEIADLGYIVDFKQAKQILPSKARRKQWYNKTDDCIGYAYLLSLDVAKEEGCIVYEFRLKEEE